MTDGIGGFCRDFGCEGLPYVLYRDFVTRIDPPSRPADPHPPERDDARGSHTVSDSVSPQPSTALRWMTAS